MELANPAPGSPSAAPDDGADLALVPLRHPWRWLSAAVVLLLLVLVLSSLARNPNLDIGTVGEYLFSEPVLSGVRATIWLTVVAMILGVLGAVFVAVMRLSANPVLSTVAWGFTWFFRATPLLVQIIFWGFLGALYQRITISIPFTDWTLIDAPTSSVITPITASILALTFNEAAYAAEIVRAGIVSVDRGQQEAAAALGLTSSQTMRTVVLPQAMRVIIPPMGNETITMLKSTSLTAVVGGVELLSTVQSIYNQNFKVMPLLTVAALWYLALVSVLSLGQYFLERRYGRGDQPTAKTPGALQRWVVGVRGGKP